jgi:hypothetical protein
MDAIILYLVQGITVLCAFFLGAYVYQRGQSDQSIVPQLNLNKKEVDPQPDWDQV